MAIVQDWLPASRQNYETLLWWWQFYPIVGSMQWFVSWYGMGKTSVASKLNIPGRIAWMTMEVPGFVTLLYIMSTLPGEHGITDLPWQNKVLGSLFVIHYIYRAVLFPIIQPSMSPIHAAVWASAIFFQLCNATAIGSWLAAYGPTTQDEWRAQSSVLQFSIGVVVFFVGLTANYFSDEELREIRRGELGRQNGLKKQGRTVDKHYEVPQNGLFKYMLFPHYFMEWVEWTGYWIAAGVSCTPARCFLLNEISAMLPRAVAGGKWYKEKFGEDKIKGNWVIIPGVY
ncbi:Uu.00g069250.m01.CDS01 [Anthostomella pinea]|uniref:Uu.00g069250.m01.CDS01 n=1 Tax=Anthostomella pinea TaxID=933095 RepID=A0AAI8YNL1_9PEZI|nr:Uu.00g069250.m01.CDS01 [Anthostomella pinea]